MRVASKTATTTAPNAAECQSFLDNLIAVFAVVRLLNDSLNWVLSKFEILPPQISELMKVEECQAKFICYGRRGSARATSLLIQMERSCFGTN